MRRLLRPRLAIVPVLAVLLLPLPAEPAAVEDDLARGDALLDARRYPEAYAAFEAAAKGSAAPCGECFLGMATAGNRGSVGDAASAARKATQLLPAGDLQVSAYNQLGIALFRKGGPKDLEEAVTAFRTVVERTGGRAVMARRSLGEALLKLGRDAEGVEALKGFLALSPTGPDADRARRLIEDPRRARPQAAPAFRFGTLDGDELTPARFRGKVLLLDFWATWCTPCRESLPHLKRLREQLQGQPFALVGVATDSDEAAVRKYVEENGLTWPQAFDRGAKASRELFGIEGLPAWVLVGPDGTILATGGGWSREYGEAVAREVRKAVADAAGKPKG